MNKRKEKLRKIDLPKHMRYETARGWMVRGDSNTDDYDFARKYERTHPRWKQYHKKIDHNSTYWKRYRAYKIEDLHKKKLRRMYSKHDHALYFKRVDFYNIYRFDDDWARQAKMFNDILIKHTENGEKRYEEINRVKWVNNNRGIKSKPNDKVRLRRILKLSNEAVKHDVINGKYFDDNLHYSTY